MSEQSEYMNNSNNEEQMTLIIRDNSINRNSYRKPGQNNSIFLFHLFILYLGYFLFNKIDYIILNIIGLIIISIGIKYFLYQFFKFYFRYYIHKKLNKFLDVFISCARIPNAQVNSQIREVLTNLGIVISRIA